MKIKLTNNVWGLVDPQTKYLKCSCCNNFNSNVANLAQFHTHSRTECGHQVSGPWHVLWTGTQHGNSSPSFSLNTNHQCCNFWLQLTVINTNNTQFWPSNGATIDNFLSFPHNQLLCISIFSHHCSCRHLENLTFKIRQKTSIYFIKSKLSKNFMICILHANYE